MPKTAQIKKIKVSVAKIVQEAAAPKEPKFILHKDLDRSGEIAMYYGFTAKETPEIKRSDIENSKGLIDGDFVEYDAAGDESKLPLHVEEKIAILRTYQDEEMHTLPQPVMLYFKGAFKGSLVKKSAHFPRYCDLDILGSSKSIGEAILIKTALTILKEEGYENVCVEINSIGDKDSIARFTRDLTAYYRKHMHELHPDCRQLLKKDPFELLGCKNEKCKPINESAPKSMNFLSEASRQHFREVLEYLEHLEIPYRINNNLIGNRKYCTETIFEIINIDAEGKKDAPKTLAIGVRYDGLSKKIGAKREIPGAGLSILIKPSPKSDLKKEVKKTKNPSVFFIQLSFDAKLHSLKIIEMLRQAKIPVHQSLSKDKLLAQITTAEKMKIPIMILMGKKEAVEGTVIVRDMETRSQETILITDLVDHLKKLLGKAH
jgi:histidyl-tRNA synthetase